MTANEFKTLKAFCRSCRKFAYVGLLNDGLLVDTQVEKRLDCSDERRMELGIEIFG